VLSINPEKLNLEAVGHRVILASSCLGSPRQMSERYHDAMAIVRYFHKPDLFITITCNCHKSWLSKADFIWLIVISHKVCLCFTLCSQLTYSSQMTRTCVSSLCYNWLMFLWLTIVSHNDVMTFAHDSHYESRVPRRWRTLRTWHVLCFMIGLQYVAQWLIGAIWWISSMTRYES